jgi:predicted Zn-dependent protease
VLRNHQKGYARTADFSDGAIRETVRAALSIARTTMPDPFAGLPERDEFAWVGETLAMAESVNSTIKSFKKTLGIKSTEQVSIKCPSCGATLTGTEGETVKCPYCWTFTTL